MSLISERACVQENPNSNGHAPYCPDLGLYKDPRLREMAEPRAETGNSQDELRISMFC